MDPDVARRTALYDKVTEPLLADPAVQRSTMMGYPCLRVNGEFFASVERSTGHLIVKLPAPRVGELVESGAGLPFAPNGRVFREWVACPVLDEGEWIALLDEARVFVGG